MNAKMVKFTQETIIVREGSNTDMYKIISGHAEVYVGFGTKQEALIRIIGPQSCFGEIGMLLDKPSIYTVRAYSDILALRIRKEDMFDELVRPALEDLKEWFNEHVGRSEEAIRACTELTDRRATEACRCSRRAYSCSRRACGQSERRNSQAERTACKPAES